jgi:hypothetical protein
VFLLANVARPAAIAAIPMSRTATGFPGVVVTSRDVILSSRPA